MLILFFHSASCYFALASCSLSVFCWLLKFIHKIPFQCPFVVQNLKFCWVHSTCFICLPRCVLVLLILLLCSRYFLWPSLKMTGYYWAFVGLLHVSQGFETGSTNKIVELLVCIYTADCYFPCYFSALRQLFSDDSITVNCPIYLLLIYLIWYPFNFSFRIFCPCLATVLIWFSFLSLPISGFLVLLRAIHSWSACSLKEQSIFY